MEPLILTALIGSITTIASPIITFYITRTYQQRDLQKPITLRRRNLEGIWSGVEEQMVDSGEILNVKIHCHLQWKGKLLKGRYIFHCNYQEKEINETLILEGGMHYNRFIRLNYSALDKVQCGSILLELDESGEYLEGLIVGFGCTFKEICTGKLKLEKVS